MRQFLAGLLLGLGVMYWWTYQKEAFLDQVHVWFAEASSDPDADAKIEKMTSRKR
jgi:hypothetical protein